MESKISVLMGIYNCAGTLPEAIESIFDQTYTNWELILCDDGSKDGTYAVAESYRQQFPEKIILLKNEKNMGLNHTLNRCLAKASGEFVARMDGDDISVPERFEKEIEALRSNPDIAVVSTAMVYFDEAGQWGRGKAVPYPEKFDFMHGTPFCHAPCMVRRAVMEEIGGYTDEDKIVGNGIIKCQTRTTMRSARKADFYPRNFCIFICEE
ncbi:MAG: glycosyltransferase family 2 protein [Oscillospiraceae bacterium]|nr:glycosyltransferase family 2 protein [Oscillospiraceae bacterium]